MLNQSIIDRWGAFALAPGENLCIIVHMNGPEKIHVILTGGTIDSYYEGAKDSVIPNKISVIPDVLKGFRLADKITSTQVCMKDSRDLTDSDRKKILDAVQKSAHDKIIITHGTYTMPDTARYLKAHLSPSDKTIVLTGSFIPIHGFAPSDGTFNLGYALAVVKTLPPGIYVTMNGKVFNPEDVLKNLSEGTFTSILGEK